MVFCIENRNENFKPCNFVGIYYQKGYKYEKRCFECNEVSEFKVFFSVSQIFAWFFSSPLCSIWSIIILINFIKCLDMRLVPFLFLLARPKMHKKPLIFTHNGIKKFFFLQLNQFFEGPGELWTSFIHIWDEFPPQIQFLVHFSQFRLIFNWIFFVWLLPGKYIYNLIKIKVKNILI